MRLSILKFFADESGATAIGTTVHRQAVMSISADLISVAMATAGTAGINPLRSRHSLFIQSAQYRYPREHQPAGASLGSVDQVLHRDLPSFLLLNIFRQSHDVVGGVLQSLELAAAA